MATTPTPWSELPKKNCGWWVDPTRDALTEVIDNATKLPPESLRKMGSCGHALVEEKYQWPAIAESTLDVYRWMTGSGRMPSCLYGG
jgi:glycosyltransferase involved in cell wall biosynthesis